MSDNPDLPPSLAVTVNTPFHRLTLEELMHERNHWQLIFESATGWRGSIAAAREVLNYIEREINHRQKP